MNGLQSNLKRLFDKNCVLACLYLSVCLFVLPQSVIVFFSSVRYCMHIFLSLCLSLSDYLSLHSQQSVFVYLSVIKTLTIFLRRVESAHACLPFILCVSLYLCLSLVSVCLCLSICLSLSIIVSLKKALVCFHQNLSKIEQEQEILNRRRQ